MIKYYSVHFAIDGDAEILPDVEITTRYAKNGSIYHGTLFFPIKSSEDIKDIYVHAKDFVKSVERELVEKKDA